MGVKLRIPFETPDAKIMISASIGIAIYPDVASTPEELFDRADYALYQSKREHRGNSTLFTNKHIVEIHRDARVEQTLRQADLATELSVVYQPILDVTSGKTVGFEALARWDSRILGTVAPAQFIPIAERAGIINMLLTIGNGFPFGLLFLLAILALVAVRGPYAAGWLVPPAEPMLGTGPKAPLLEREPAPPPAVSRQVEAQPIPRDQAPS